MNKTQRTEFAKRVFIYFLIAIPMSYALMKVIEQKYTVIFWTYMAVLGISGLIADWNQYEPDHDKKSTFVKVSETICWVCFLALLLWYFVMIRFME